LFLRAVGAVAPPAPLTRETGRRLLGWGFNTLGPGSSPDLADAGLHHLANADFLHAGAPVIHAHGLHLPDVFDPGWPAHCDTRAARLALQWRGRRDLVGHHTDTDLVW